MVLGILIPTNAYHNFRPITDELQDYKIVDKKKGTIETVDDLKDASVEEKKKQKKLTNALQDSETDVLQLLRKVRALEIICRTLVPEDKFHELLEQNLALDHTFKEKTDEKPKNGNQIGDDTLKWAKERMELHYNSCANHIVNQAKITRAERIEAEMEKVQVQVGN